MLEAASQHGLSFGLGVVTVAGSLLKTGPQSYLVGAQVRTTSLQPYRHRLAWLAVIKPEVVSSCPMMTSTTSPVPARPALPGYQILAIDARTGAAGIVYSAKANALCNSPGYRPPSVAPVVEFVSLPWTLIRRGPGPQSASITYQPRPCDIRSFGTFEGTGQSAVFADGGNPARVNVVLERMITTCGPPAIASLLLRSGDLKTNLPPHLVHAPVGAEDVSPTS